METIDTAFGVFTKDCQGRLQLTYDYESAAIASFKKITERLGANTLIDIGSNIGVYPVFCSSIASLTSLHCFEPAPAAYSLLEKNISIQKDPSRIFTYQIAASDKEGLVPFRIVNPTSGANAITDDASSIDAVQVQAATIDQTLTVKGSVISVKIDVEGHEIAVLEGMRDTLRANTGYIQLESLKAEKVDRAVRILCGLGYQKCFSLRDDHLFLHEDLSQNKQIVLDAISEALYFDLRDLLHLRREKRVIARTARQLREMAGYKKDPLFIPLGSDPFTDR